MKLSYINISFKVLGYFSSHLIAGQGKATPEYGKRERDIRLLRGRAHSQGGADKVLEKVDAPRSFLRTQALIFLNVLVPALEPWTPPILLVE